MNIDSNLKSEIVNEFKKMPSELKNKLVEQRENNDEYLFDTGYQICLMKTLDLLVDSKLKDDEITALLQKHFDLRLSEANNMIKTAKNRKNRNKTK